MPSEPSISLIVPALNEEKVVASVLEGIHAQVAARFPAFEIIAVDDGSTDGTGRIMDEFARTHAGVSVIHNPGNRGLGASFIVGLERAQHDYVMLLCGDGGLPARSLPVIFERIGTADLVIPYMDNLRRIKTPSRYLLSRAYTSLLNLLFGFGLCYYNGLPVYRRKLLSAIRINSQGFGFQGEILVKMLKSGCTFAEVGVEGAEETGRSFALRPSNVLSVARTFVYLILEIMRFSPISPEVIADARASSVPVAPAASVTPHQTTGRQVGPT